MIKYFWLQEKLHCKLGEIEILVKNQQNAFFKNYFLRGRKEAIKAKIKQFLNLTTVKVHQNRCTLTKNRDERLYNKLVSLEIFILRNNIVFSIGRACRWYNEAVESNSCH